ncbi:MAG: hypothetical protein NT075_34200 [Chloroflexi bacterium]|nr:hypothetical protein [Chloroflexota bacterium]
MPTVNIVAELTVDDLLEAVSKLDEAEIVKFEVGFEKIWLKRNAIIDEEATQIVEKHRLLPDEQLRVRELLLRNREMTLTEAEERELDSYMAKMDEALSETAEELLELATARQKKEFDQNR